MWCGGLDEKVIKKRKGRTRTVPRSKGYFGDKN